MQMMDDWRNPGFRQNMISKIEEAILQFGASMNASDLEGQLFSKARHKEEYMSLVTRIIMHIKDRGSKKHGVGPGVMGQPNQPPGGVNQVGGPMPGGQAQMGMMNQINPMQQMNQMMGQQGMVHSMQNPQLVQQMQSGMGQGGQMIGGMPQQQGGQQAQQQHQMGQQGQGQMMGQNQLGMGMSQAQQMQMQQHLQQQAAQQQLGNAQLQQMQQQQMQQNLLQQQQQQQQGNQQSMMMQGGQQGQVQMMQQGGQPGQGMMGGQGQPQLMQMQGQAQQQQSMMQATSQAQQMQGAQQQAQQQQMMQGGPQQQQQQAQQQAMMQGPGGPQQGPQGATPQQQAQMMQVRGMSPQMVGGRLMSPQPNVNNPLTALAHAQQQRKAQQQRPMVPPNAMGIPRPEHGPSYSMNSMNRLYYGSNMQQQVPQSQINEFNAQQQALQQQQQQQRAAAAGPYVQTNASQGVPSPSPGGGMGQQQSTFVNSPGSQNMMHRPSAPSGVNVGGHSPYPPQIVNVPSPSTNLNTPMPMAPTPSPRNAEDQACFEKIKELKKYTDLLQRMIAKAGADDIEKSSKMKKLLEILTNPNQRVSMEILLKCEVALKKMERQQHDAGGVLAPSSSTSVPTPQPKDSTSPFQQIQDAVLGSLKFGSSSHTFLRTFRQSVEALTGQPFATSPEPTDTEAEYYFPDPEPTRALPGVLRRELKIIDNRFKVRVVYNPQSPLSIVLHVSLMEPRLPRVPPLKVYVPPGYPDDCPSVMDLRSAAYGTTSFLKSVAKTLQSRLLHMPQRFTVLELLRCWEMSVRQVSNPHYKATAATRRQVSNSLALAFL